MTIDAARPRSFDSSSPVLAYWLARAQGLEVAAGRRRGVVEEVRYGTDGQAVQLVVRFGRRERLVPASAVQSVVPYDELLILRAPSVEPAPGAPARPPRLAPGARRMSEVGGSTARAAAAGSAIVAAGAGRAASESWSATRRAGGWLGPRAAAAWAALIAAILVALSWLAARAGALAGWLRVHVPAAARALRAQLDAITGGHDARDDTFPAPAPASRAPDDARADRHAA